MTIICTYCQSNCIKNNFVKCDSCNNNYDLKCAQRLTPKFSKSILDAIVSSKDGKGYVCHNCPSKSKNFSTNDLLAIFENGIAKLSKQIDESGIEIKGMSSKIDQFDSRLNGIADQISGEVVPQLATIKNGLDDCLQQVNNVREETGIKIEQLQMENNSLRRVMNRNDLVISGLPMNLSTEAVLQIVINIAKFYEVMLVESDINQITWIKKRSAMLVKYNSCWKRDLIMQRYRKNYKLYLNNIYDNNWLNSNQQNLDEPTDSNQIGSRKEPAIESRVYINDHATPMESKLQYLCRKLLKEGHIKKYKFIYGNEPKVKITKTDDFEEIMNLNSVLVFCKPFGI